MKPFVQLFVFLHVISNVPSARKDFFYTCFGAVVPGLPKCTQPNSSVLVWVFVVSPPPPATPRSGKLRQLLTQAEATVARQERELREAQRRAEAQLQALEGSAVALQLGRVCACVRDG